MCVIVDANLCSIVLKKTANQTYKKLQTAIFSNKLTLVYGGKLTNEYSKAGVLDVIGKLSQSGRAIRIADQLIEAELGIAGRHCKSNDTHVIALARADRRRAHVLCSDDGLLQKDFKDKRLIDKPRGTIYSPSRHIQSLANC